MKQFAFLALLHFSLLGYGAQVISDLDHPACEELHLAKNLRIYKDPSLFLGLVGQIYGEPSVGWKALLNESPILTQLKGNAHIMRLGPEREFKNFGVVSKLYELADPAFKGRLNPKNKMKNPQIVPIKICGDSYGDSLGFVLSEDLRLAQIEEYEEGTLPPSVYPNPIPKLKK